MPAVNAIAWFEIGTDNPAEAERFYGDVFGLTVGHPGPTATDSPSAASSARPSGARSSAG